MRHITPHCARPVGRAHLLLAGAICLGFMLCGGQRPPAFAACNLIPQTTKTFNSVLGSANRPFAAPGEPIDVSVRACDTASPGFDLTLQNNIVTVVFTPSGGPPHAVVLTAAADCSALTTELSSCAALLGTTPLCVAGAGLQLIPNPPAPDNLRFIFPDTSSLVPAAAPGRTLAGPAAIAVSTASNLPQACGLASASCSAQTGMIACVDDFFENTTGTCSTAVPAGTFGHFTALPVQNDYATDCFGSAAVCSPTAAEFRGTTDKDGNVLLPMNWQKILVRDAGVPAPRLLRAVLDPLVALRIPGASFLASFTPEGGPLAPIFVPQFDPNAPSNALTLFGSADAPYTVLRLQRRSAVFEQCAGGVNAGLPCDDNSDCPGMCAGGVNAGKRCDTDSDCPSSTCGPAGTCGPTACFGGAQNGQPCNSDGNCPGGECGPALFNVASFAVSGVGPVVIPRSAPGVCQALQASQPCSTNSQCSAACSADPSCSSPLCVEYALSAEDPVDLQSLTAQSQNVFAFTLDENVDLRDRNGDGDTTDPAVVTLRDRTTGAEQPLGAPAGCGITGTPEGRAIGLLHQPPFRFPALATEDDALAFLELEAGQNFCDENGDGDRLDALLRVFKLGPTELTAGIIPVRAADAAPMVNGQSVVISNGRVFYRASEGDMAQQSIDRVSVGDPNAAQINGFDSDMGGITAGGRFVTFDSFGDAPGTGDTNCTLDVYLRDRQLGTTELASLTNSGTQLQPVFGGGGACCSAVSDDGRFVAFAGAANNLIAPGGHFGSNFQDLYVRDRCIANGSSVAGCTAGTELVNVPPSGEQFANQTFDFAMTPDGRFVAFANALAGGACGIFLRDRVAGTTEFVSPNTSGASPNNCFTDMPAISADGRYVAFLSAASDLVASDTNGKDDIFVRDRCMSGGVAVAGCTPSTSLVSVASDGTQGNNNANPGAYPPAISADGRFVAFFSAATNLVPGDNNATFDVFVHDRTTGITERVVATDGTEGNGGSSIPSLSADGRFVVFTSTATNFGAPVSGGTCIHDRTLGLTELVVATPGTSGNTNNIGPIISSDGHFVAFSSYNATLVAGDTNGAQDAFVRGPDLTDPLHIDSLLFPNGQLTDSVLEVLDTTTVSPTLSTLCPALAVSVVAGQASFLRPESVVGTAACPGGSLNNDSDTRDTVVQYWPGSGAVQNLGVAATAVSMSGVCAGGTNPGFACGTDADCPFSTCTPSWIAALVSERGQNMTDFNHDGQADDNVVQVHHLGDPPTTWTNVGQAAATLQAEGTLAVFTTPRANGARLLAYDMAAAKLTNTGQPAEEFVIGQQTPGCAQGPLIAFRTSEALVGKDLNGDGDTTDFVLQLWAPGLGVINTHEAVTPCTLAACDPRQPYRVSGSTVKFLTSESAQNQDLDGNGTMTDLVLQIIDVCTGTRTVVGAVDPTASTTNPLISAGSTSPGTAAASVVITTGQRCMTTTTSCTTDANCTSSERCLGGLCSTIVAVPASCATNADCAAPATCRDDQFAAAPAVVPAHDSVVLPVKPLTVTIPPQQNAVTKTFKVTVRNADILPKPEQPGHTVRLAITDGTCPAGTVTGLPDFDVKNAGAQDSVLLAGGQSKAATATLNVTATNFPSAHNILAPQRCTLMLHVDAVQAGNADPSPSNAAVPVELNVFNASAPPPTAAHNAVIPSVAPVHLSIGGNKTAVTKNVSVRPVNAVIGGGPEMITLSARDGDCPLGTVSNFSPQTVTLSGGESATVSVPVTATSAGFAAPSKKSPARCTAILTAAPAGTDPELSNNTTKVVIDVKD